MTNKERSLRRKIKLREKRATQFLHAASQLKDSCTHSFRNKGGLWQCRVCDYVQGNTCPRSPTKSCEYNRIMSNFGEAYVDSLSKDEAYKYLHHCKHCGQPDERRV